MSSVLKTNELVENWGQVEANCRTLEAARRSQDAQLRKDYESLIKRGICFVVYLSESVVAFAPSKFVGYVQNEIATHLKVRDAERHGGETNRAVTEILDRHPVPDSWAENRYMEFCKKLGFTAKTAGTGGNQRKYWMTDEAIDICEEAAIAEIENDPNLSKTEKEQLVKARRGQGQFRTDLISLWGQCCMTGCAAIKVMRASHIKPWRECIDFERLDKFNGLLLTPNADALFDNGYITFDDDGEMLVSQDLRKEDRETLLGNCGRRIQIYEENRPYLEYHRENCFRK